MKPVLVTGGGGFIGVNLVKHLLAHGYETRVMDNFSAASRGRLAGLDAQVVEGDIRDPEAAEAALRGCRAVVHLAARTNVIDSIKDPVGDMQVNVCGVVNVLDAMRRLGMEGARFVFASSGAPLGNQPPPACEKVAPKPVSPYGASKTAGEAYCSAFHGSFGIETVALRFSNVYGPLSENKTSVVAGFTRGILSGRGITIYGDGGQTRDFIFVGDICRAIHQGLETPGVGGSLFQVATGVETSVRELAEKLVAVSGRDANISHLPARRGEVERNFSDISLAAGRLGFTPFFSLDNGLEITYQWFRETRNF